jgi:3-oxoacyl-[acyl-carrier protein] reductase
MKDVMGEPKQIIKSSTKVAVVTGAAKGIGSAIALRLARDGYKVVINYLTSEKAAEQLMESIQVEGGISMLYRADMSCSSEVDAMVQHVVQCWGGVDVLINNSGVMVDTLTEEISDEEWNRLIAINLNSVFYASRAVIPHFKAAGSGRIINISSQAALTGSARHAHYAAAKAGVLGFSFSLAKELGAYGITVNIVSPGRIVTDMITERMDGRLNEWMAQTPLKRLGRTEEVADAVAYLVSNQASYITGLNMHVNGGLLMG